MDEDYPKTLAELARRFGTEEACAEYLARLRWPDGFTCPRCRATDPWRLGNGLRLCRQCRAQVSIKAGTVFADSHLPLSDWFRAMWHITSQKNGASALGLQRVMGWGSYETAWTCLHKLRRAMVRPGRDRLQGVVEMDETFVGGERPGKRGRGAAGKSLVVIAVELLEPQGIGRIRLLRVASAAAAALTPAALAMVEPGSVVRTDDWNGYVGLANPDALTQLGQALRFYGVHLLYAPTPQAKGKVERRHSYWQNRLVPLLAADHIRQLDGANRLLDQLVPHANQHEIHRELGQTPHQAHQQALAQKRSVIRPAPKCPWWPFVWSLQTRVRVGDDGQVPVGTLRQRIDAPPRARVIRCLRPDGDIFYLRHAPTPLTKPIVLLHCPVF